MPPLHVSASDQRRATLPHMPAPQPLIPQLSPRQHAMLREMGVPLWWPEAGVPAPAAAERTRTTPAPTTVAAQAPAPALTPAPSAASAHRPANLLRVEHSAPSHTQPQHTERPATPHPATQLASIEALQTEARACTRCALANSRQCAVPGAGAAPADWLLVGDAPDDDEDRSGQVATGSAGQLLDRMLAAMGLARGDNVHITNALKCRPPRNRNPSLAEIAECSPYLLRQIALLRPKIIVAMGRFAPQILLHQGGALASEGLLQTPLGTLRGRVYTLTLGGHTCALVATYAPAQLLRSPSEKGKAWADLCLALDAMERLRG